MNLKNAHTQTEADLLDQARRFDPEALTMIYDLYSDALYRYALRVIGDAFLAEECVAETFHRLLRAFHQGGGPNSHLRAYLYRIAHNWLNDYFRTHRIPDISLDLVDVQGEATPQEAYSLTEQQNTIRAALIRLTPDQRQVILLKYFEGWKNKEVAAALQKPVGAIKSLHHRAMAALERILVHSNAEKKVF